MRIYIADLAAYNEGRLVGKWIEADSAVNEAEDFLAEIAPHEDIAIHAHEGFGLTVGEYESMQDIEDFAEVYDKVQDGDAFAAWLDYQGYGLSEAKDRKEEFEDAYQGQHDSEEDYAEQLLDDTGELNSIPEHLRYYFDYDAYARDQLISDCFSVKCKTGGIYVFNNY